MIIGRTEELRRLHSAFSSEYSEFVAVYGRRRIGKTFLIRECFDYHFTFQHTGVYNGSLSEQIRAFCDALFESGLTEAGASDFRVPGNWFDAFSLLKKLIRTSNEKKKIIFFDELSWMDTPNSKFLMSLEHFWNSWASARKDILLIVCASATSWILDKVIHNKGGLYNRLSLAINLQPFTLAECRELIEKKGIVMNLYQIIECYMVMGGVPYYWDFLEKEYSLTQNIDRIFFAQNAPLKDEFNYLFRALFRNPDDYLSLIATLGKKKAGMNREELIAASGIINSGALTKKLNELESCGFIRKYNYFGTKRKGAVYQLTDPFTLFYYKFLNHDTLEENFWEHRENTPERNAWEGLAFERVCLDHIVQIKKKLGISGVQTSVHAWSCQADAEKGIHGSQIDLLIVRNDQVINLCEMKFATGAYTVTKEVDESVRHKISDLKTVTKTKYAIHTTIVTTYGLSENSYAHNVQSVVTAEDLFLW